MPTGSFDLSPVPGGQAVQAVPIVVALYEPGQENPYKILPNVRCLRIDYREGPEPPLARFQYFMDDLLEATMGWPSQFEQLWPIDAQGDYVVLTDDRLVVLPGPGRKPDRPVRRVRPDPASRPGGPAAVGHVRRPGSGDPAVGQPYHRPTSSAMPRRLVRPTERQTS